MTKSMSIAPTTVLQRYFTHQLALRLDARLVASWLWNPAGLLTRCHALEVLAGEGLVHRFGFVARGVTVAAANAAVLHTRISDTEQWAKQRHADASMGGGAAGGARAVPAGTTSQW